MNDCIRPVKTTIINADESCFSCPQFYELNSCDECKVFEHYRQQRHEAEREADQAGDEMPQDEWEAITEER